jgi:hypothetical protein
VVVGSTSASVPAASVLTRQFSAATGSMPARAGGDLPSSSYNSIAS